MATRKPATYHCPATRWSLDDLVAALLQRRTWTMSRSSIWRLLEEADLKPHRSVYWLNSHSPDFEAKAQELFPNKGSGRLSSKTLWREPADGDANPR